MLSTRVNARAVGHLQPATEQFPRCVVLYVEYSRYIREKPRSRSLFAPSRRSFTDAVLVEIAAPSCSRFSVPKAEFPRGNACRRRERRVPVVRGPSWREVVHVVPSFPVPATGKVRITRVKVRVNNKKRILYYF